MSKTRTLGFTVMGDRFYAGDQYAVTPTDTEVADLLARVLEAAGHKVPDQVANEHSASAEYYRNGVLSELSMWRAALARDAAAKEQERVEEAERLALYSEFMSVGAGAPDTVDRVRRVTDRAYELGARAPQGKETQE